MLLCVEALRQCAVRQVLLDVRVDLFTDATQGLLQVLVVALLDHCVYCVGKCLHRAARECLNLKEALEHGSLALSEVLIQCSFNFIVTATCLLEDGAPCLRDKRLDLDVILLDVSQAVLHQQIQVFGVAEDQLRSMLRDLLDQPGRAHAHARRR